MRIIRLSVVVAQTFSRTGSAQSLTFAISPCEIHLDPLPRRSYYCPEEVRQMKCLKGLLYAVLIALTGGVAAAVVMFWFRLKEDEKEAK